MLLTYVKDEGVTERIVSVVTSMDQKLCVWKDSIAVPTGECIHTETGGSYMVSTLNIAICTIANRTELLHHHALRLSWPAVFVYYQLPSGRWGPSTGFHNSKLHET